MSKKILIIEDSGPHLKRIKKELEKVEDFIVFPIIGKSNLKYQDNIRNLLRTKREECFEELIIFYKDTDLFIVDITLDKNKSDDTLGLDFINYLKENTTKLEKPLEFIIISNHGKFKITDKDIDVNKHYISKVDNQKDFPKLIRKKAASFLNIQDAETEDIEEESNWQRFDKKITRTIILIFFYLLILLTSFYGIWNIGKEVFHNTLFANSHTIKNNSSDFDSNNHINDSIIKNNPTKNNNQLKAEFVNPEDEIKKKIEIHRYDEDTEPLKFVEHIFLYFLPLFIVLGFFSYYKTTSDIRLKNGNENDIDYHKAMDSIHNTKVILLSSILSFALIKIIEKVFISGKQTLLELISYGVFMIILMAFILLSNKQK